MAKHAPTLGEQMIEHVPALRRYALVLVRTGARADDLVQDCLERALSRARLYQPDTNLRAWLFTVMRNIAVTQARKNRLRTTYAVELRAMTRHVAAASQAETIALKESLALLGALSPGEREAIDLMAIQDMSYEQAASLSGLPTGTLKSRLSRGRQHLRELADPGHAAD